MCQRLMFCDSEIMFAGHSHGGGGSHSHGGEKEDEARALMVQSPQVTEDNSNTAVTIEMAEDGSAAKTRKSLML